MSDVAMRLKKARQEKGCTAEEVAKECGISVNAVYMYENGYRIPRDEIKKAMATFYGVTVQRLFFD